jgi:hypothetical protein
MQVLQVLQVLQVSVLSYIGPRVRMAQEKTKGITKQYNELPPPQPLFPALSLSVVCRVYNNIDTTIISGITRYHYNYWLVAPDTTIIIHTRLN